MFCEKCGNRLDDDSLFCEHCGNRVKEEINLNNNQINVSSSNNVAQVKKKMSKKAKIILGVIGLIVVVFGSLYGYFYSQTTAKSVLETYMKSMSNGNVSALFDCLDIEESDFVSKEQFIKVNEDNNQQKLFSYSIGDVTYSTDKNTAVFKIKYKYNASDSDMEKTITLTRKDKNKYLIFANWKVQASDYGTVKDFEVRTLSGSKVTINGKKVDKKYLDKDVSKDYMDVYVIPNLLVGRNEMIFELPMGSKVTKEVDIKSYNTYYVPSFDVEDLNNKELSAINDLGKKTINTIYNGIINGKSFTDISSELSFDKSNNTSLTNSYDNLVSDVNDNYSGTKLTKFDVKDINVTSISMSTSGLLVNYQVKYEYTVLYNTDKTNTATKSNNIKLYLNYSDSKYELKNIYYMVTYFSKYSY